MNTEILIETKPISFLIFAKNIFIKENTDYSKAEK